MNITKEKLAKFVGARLSATREFGVFTDQLVDDLFPLIQAVEKNVERIHLFTYHH
jgi:hypothetical protein